MPDLWTGPYQPLRVVAHLAGPIAAVPEEPLLPLDAVLEFAAFRLGWPAIDPRVRVGRRLPSSAENPVNFVLPVKRHGHKQDPDWFWRASWASLPAGHEQDRAYWNRRFDGADPALTDHLDFDSRRGNVPTGAGRYKSYHMPLCLLVAPRLEWHCLGAADGVARLLREVTHLGHKRSQGLGEVRRWEIWPAREDLSLFDAEGRPARALPLAGFREPIDPSSRTMVCAIRAPSWHPSRRRECAVPDVPRPGLRAVS